MENTVINNPQPEDNGESDSFEDLNCSNSGPSNDRQSSYLSENSS